MVAIDQSAKARIPRPPLTARGRGFGHLAQALQFVERPPATGRKLRVMFFGQPSGGANQMGQTSLSMIDPGLIHPVAIAHQDARPIRDQIAKGIFLKSDGSS